MSQPTLPPTRTCSWFQLDLLGLWFEAAVGQANEEVAQGPTSTIKIIDSDGQPARGVCVTSNPQRFNWSRTVLTDDDGIATIPSIDEPLGHRSLRLEADSRSDVVSWNIR